LISKLLRTTNDNLLCILQKRYTHDLMLGWTNATIAHNVESMIFKWFIIDKFCIISKNFENNNKTCNFHWKEIFCRNPSLGLMTKARVYKVVGQEGSQESHNILLGAWEGVKEWTLTPQRSSTLGIGVLADSQIFRRQLQGSKLNGLKSFLYQWKALGT